MVYLERLTHFWGYFASNFSLKRPPVAKIGTKMVRAIERQGRKTALDDMLHDKVHMKPEHLELAFEHYAKETFGWEIKDRSKNETFQVIKDKIRREGKCNKCGGLKKRCDPCRERIRCRFCDNNHHDISVCQ